MSHILLVRHGQTLFNVKHRMQGWCDSPLTQEGITQALNVGKALSSVPIETCYVSTSERTRDTAMYILKDRDIEINPTKALKEMNFGTLEAEYEKDVFALQLSMDDGLLSYQGESVEMVQDRVFSKLQEIGKKHSGVILVVTHGGVIYSIIQKLEPSRIEDGNVTEWIKNGSVTHLVYENDQLILKEVGVELD